MFLSLTIANRADLDEMPHFAVSLLGLHSLTVYPVYGFRVGKAKPNYVLIYRQKYLEINLHFVSVIMAQLFSNIN